MLFPTTKKQQIAYLLVWFLDRNMRYMEVDLNRFIRNNVSSTTVDDPRLSVDHLRVAMIESAYVLRTEDGGQYCVAPGYIEPDRLLDELVRRAARDSTAEVVACPLCLSYWKPRSLLTHLRKYHDQSKAWDQILALYLGK